MKRTLTLLALVALCACSKTPAGATTANAATPSSQAGSPQPGGTAPPAGAVLGPEPAKPVPAQLPEVLARVNGEAVTKAEFERAVAALEARNGGPVPPDQRDRIFAACSIRSSASSCSCRRGRARKVAVADSEVDARMKEIQGQFPSEDAFKQMLTRARRRSSRCAADARQDMTVQKLLENADR